jgi:alpha-tubulin suppressor-like RCC1 family protein
VQVSAGETHACAVRDDHTIWCWGADDAGQLGDGGTTEQLTATQVGRGDGEAFDGALRVAAGALFTCAARPDNVWCWGDNAFAQLGQPGGPAASATPVVALPVAADALAAGGAHACAVETGGAAWCWGRAEDGQIGEPGLPGPGVAPVRVWSGNGTPLGAVASVAAGNVHSCASTSDGRVSCWGAGVDGQLGHGENAGAETAVEVRSATAALTDVVEVTAGIDGYQGPAGRHSCARQADAVWCWGAISGAASGDEPPLRSPLALPVELSAVCP